MPAPDSVDRLRCCWLLGAYVSLDCGRGQGGGSADGRDYEIAGFGWHQGWNDRVNSDAVQEYEKNLVDLIHKIREQWGEKLPVVIASTDIGGRDLQGNALALVADLLPACRTFSQDSRALHEDVSS